MHFPIACLAKCLFHLSQSAPGHFQTYSFRGRFRDRSTVAKTSLCIVNHIQHKARLLFIDDLRLTYAPLAFTLLPKDTPRPHKQQSQHLSLQPEVRRISTKSHPRSSSKWQTAGPNLLLQLTSAPHFPGLLGLSVQNQMRSTTSVVGPKALGTICYRTKSLPSSCVLGLVAPTGAFSSLNTHQATRYSAASNCTLADFNVGEASQMCN